MHSVGKILKKCTGTIIITINLLFSLQQSSFDYRYSSCKTNIVQVSAARCSYVQKSAKYSTQKNVCFKVDIKKNFCVPVLINFDTIVYFLNHNIPDDNENCSISLVLRCFIQQLQRLHCNQLANGLGRYDLTFCLTVFLLRRMQFMLSQFS